MAVNLDQIHFYNPPQTKARLAKTVPGDAFNRSSSISICTDRDSQQAMGVVPDFSNPIELSDDDDHDQVAAEPCLSTAKRDGFGTENAARSVSVVPLALAEASPDLPSACPGSHQSPATTAVTPEDIFQPDGPGELLSQAFQCDHSTALTGADNADIRHPAGNQAEPVLEPVIASPQRASQTVSSAGSGQISSGDVDTRDDEPRTSVRRLVPMPCVATAPAPDNATPTSDSSLTGQNGISPGAPPDLFPILSSLSGLSGSHVIFRKKPVKPGHANYTATSSSPTAAPFPIGDQGERSASQLRSSRSQYDRALYSPIDLPRGPVRDHQTTQDVLPCGGGASPRDRGAKDPATPAGRRSNDLLLRPMSKSTRRSGPDQGCLQPRNARLRPRQAPPDYHEASDSCSDGASGSDESYMSESADHEGGEDDRTAETYSQALKRRRTLPSSATVGAARGPSRPRPSWSSIRITSGRRAQTRGIISPPTSCEPSEPGLGEEGPVTTFEEWPLDRVTLKRVVDDGVATFQLQFSWDLCTKTGAHEKAPKTRRALPSEKRGPFTDEEDALIIELKEERGIPWKEIHREYTALHPWRSVGALQVRYCTKLKDRQT